MRGADRVVTVGEGYREDLLEKGVPNSRLSVIPNGVDRDIFWPRDAMDVLQQYGIHDKFTCAYVGTIGMASGLDVAIEAAERFRDRGRDDIVLLLVGDGAERERLEATRKAEGAQESRF